MSKWKGAFRSNRFTVLDEQAFRQWVADLIADAPLSLDGDAERGFVLAGFCAVPSDRRMSPAECHETTHPADRPALSSDDTELDFFSELAEHLQETEIAIIQEVGFDELKELTAWNHAIDAQGCEVTSVNLRDNLLDLYAQGVTHAEF